MSASGSATTAASPTLASAAETTPLRVGRRRPWLNPTLLSGLVFLGVIALFTIGYPFLVDGIRPIPRSTNRPLPVRVGITRSGQTTSAGTR